MISRAPDKLRDYTIKTTEHPINLPIFAFPHSNVCLQNAQRTLCIVFRRVNHSYHQLVVAGDIGTFVLFPIILSSNCYRKALTARVHRLWCSKNGALKLHIMLSSSLSLSITTNVNKNIMHKRNKRYRYANNQQRLQYRVPSPQARF